MSVLVAERLGKLYGRRVGIDGVDLDVAEGQLFGFLGPNGAGKTTTIRVLLGFLRPTAGHARIFGLDCWHESPRIKEDVGYLPGDLRLYPRMTGEELLRVFGAVRGRDLRAPGRALARRFDLDLTVPVRSMSRGMRQKLGLVAAMAHRPRLLVLDEPTVSLDPLMRESLLRYLRELASDGGTVFFSSHTLSEVERVCDRVAIVREGRIVADEALASLRARASREVTLRWAEGARQVELEPPACLDLHERQDHLWRGSLRGPVTELIEWLRARPVADVSIGHPDLESLFRRYYEEGP